MTLDPTMVAVAAVTSAAGWTMLYAGTRKRMLELRRPKRICPACGREIVGRTCTAH
jgi:hypothetical protein